MIHSYLYLSASISLFLSFSFAAALSVTQSFTCSFSPTLFLPFSFSSTLSRHLAHSLCLILILFLDGTCAKTRIHTFTLTHSPLHTYAHTHTLTPNHSSISQKTSCPFVSHLAVHWLQLGLKTRQGVNGDSIDLHRRREQPHLVLCCRNKPLQDSRLRIPLKAEFT